MNEQSIFAAAISKKTAEERRAFLDEACGDNAQLRAQMEELLAADAAAGSFFEHPPAGLEVTVDASLSGKDTVDNELSGSLPLLEPCDKPDRIGKLDHYEIIELVGQGGMGTVLRAFDTKLSRIVAVKVMAPELAANPTAVKRFLREAQTAAAVHHDHVVTIHAIDDSHRPPFIVMQFIEGLTLQQKIDKEGALELKQILRIGSQMAAGLAAAHRTGLIHRDVKPGNILLENGVERVKITDFGLARAADDVEMTKSGMIAGTPQYMSPEQAHGEQIDSRSDLFSLGSVLYTMCTGRPAFRADTTMGTLRRVCDDTPRPIHEVNAEIPVWLCEIIEKLLAKDPQQRFQSAQEVSDLLSQHLAHLQQPASCPLPPRVGPRTAPMQPSPEIALKSIGTMFAATGAMSLVMFLAVWSTPFAIWFLAGGIITLSFALLIVVGEDRMVQSRHARAWAMAAVILSLVPLNPFLLLCLPFTIWMLVAPRRATAATTFQRTGPRAASVPVVRKAKADVEGPASIAHIVLFGLGSFALFYFSSKMIMEMERLYLGWFEWPFLIATIILSSIMLLAWLAAQACLRRRRYSLAHCFQGIAAGALLLTIGNVVKFSASPIVRQYVNNEALLEVDRAEGLVHVVVHVKKGDQVVATIDTRSESLVSVPEGEYRLQVSDASWNSPVREDEDKYNYEYSVDLSPSSRFFHGGARHRVFAQLASVKKPRADAPLMTTVGIDGKDGWLKLFNGKDLTGWKPIPAQHWRVENGVIHGSGADAFLVTDVGDFEDFHLVVEYRINADGDSGVHFRIPAPVADRRGRWGYTVTGPEAEIGVRPKPGHRSGALTVKDPDQRILATAPQPPHGHYEWGRLEVIARKDHIQILVDGKLVTDYIDRERKFQKGHIALASWEGSSNKTAVEFRKVEIKKFRLPTVIARSSRVFNGKMTAGGDENIFAIAFPPHDDLVATGHFGGAVTIWNLKTGEQLKSFPAHTKTVCSIAFAPGDKLMATGSEDSAIRLWNTETWEEVGSLSGHTGWVNFLSFLKPENSLVSVGWDFRKGTDNSVRLWDIARRSEQNTIVESLGHNTQAALSPNQTLLAVANGAAGRVRLWDLAKKSIVHDFAGLPTQPISVAFSRDGTRVAAGYLGREPQQGEWNDPENAVVRMWEVQSGKLVQEFRGHVGPVIALEFSPNDRWLLSLASDRHDATGTFVRSRVRSIRIWEVASGGEITRIEPQSRLNVARWTPDGTAICSGLRLWDPASAAAEFPKSVVESSDKPPGAIQPFVVLPIQEGGVKSYPSLADAVAAAQSGDTIEIRGNGPFATAPVHVNRPLTIRAGAGFLPVLQRVPRRAGQPLSKHLISTSAALTLEGLELDRLGPHEEATMERAAVFVEGGTLRMTNCQLKTGSAHYLVWLRSVPDAQIQNCLLVGSPASVGIALAYCGSNDRLAIRNCIFSNVVRPVVLSQEQPKPGGSVRLGMTHNTFMRFPLTWHHGALRQLQVEAVGNIIADDASLVLRDIPRGTKWTESIQSLKWRGEQNCYPPGGPLVVVQDVPQEEFQGLQAWNRLWQEPEQESIVGAPLFEGNVVEPTAEVASWRLIEGSPGKGAGGDGKDMGADIDLVGPGAAYERWKIKAEYQEWLKQTGRALSGATADSPP